VTIESYDRMADAFPTVFDFKKGEQPSSRKLTKWVKLTDNAFSLVSQAVGDPWDYQSHVGDLSPQNLGQATLARIIGPSDYVGPLGETVNSDLTSVEINLSVDGVSSWYLGFPLVKRVSAATPQALANSFEYLSVSDVSITSTAIAFSNYFGTHYSDPRDMTQKGDYHIDFAQGIIQTYAPIDPSEGGPTDTLTVTIDNLSFVGAGAPWATHNVIPIWEDSTAGVSIVETAAGPGNYRITLPGRDASGYSDAYPRVGSPNDDASSGMTGSGHAEDDVLTNHRHQATFSSRPTRNVSYRLPYSLEANYSSGDVLPGGAIKLWRNNTSSFIPLCEFEYVDGTTIDVTCPELSDVDNITGDSTNYRLIVSGTSLSEQVSYLSAVIREGQGQGMSVGGPATYPSAHFSPPMSHDRLRDRYGFSLAMETNGDFSTWASNHDNWQKRFAFTESAYPTNPHPQYLHRTGYLADDGDPNTSNAMRGWLCFAGYQTAASGHDYAIDSSVPSTPGSPIREWTYGISWGAGSFGDTYSDHPRMFFDGGEGKTWTGSGPAVKLGFGMPGSDGGIGFESTSYDAHYGAIVYEGYRGQPFYIRGIKGFNDSLDTSIHGGAVGFDMGSQNEMNYLKLLGGCRPSDGSYGTYEGDPANDPAWISQNVYTVLPITPGLSARLSAEQTRELRFRGVSYVEAPQNAQSGVGDLSGSTGSYAMSKTVQAVLTGTNRIYVEGNVFGDIRIGETIVTLSGTPDNDGDYTITNVLYDSIAGQTALTPSTPLTADQAGPAGTASWTSYEFNRYFRSPGIVGGDFFNVYGNAIFFSEEGDGKKTSFTERGREWLSDGTTAPSGIFYIPKDTYGSATAFIGYEGSGSGDYDGARFHGYLGHTRGSWINSTVGVRRGLQFEGHDDSGLHIAYNTFSGATQPASEAAEYGLSCVVYKVHNVTVSKGNNAITIADADHLPESITGPETFSKRVVGIETMARFLNVLIPISTGGGCNINGTDYFVRDFYYWVDEDLKSGMEFYLYDLASDEVDISASFTSAEFDLIVKVWYLSNRPGITSLPNESLTVPQAELMPLSP